VDDSTKRPVPSRVLDLACKCGSSKKCPVLEAIPDGFIVSEPETGAVVRFSNEQMDLAIEWLRAHRAAEAAE
jgi:hypothetical protein